MSILDEQWISMREAAGTLPRRRAGKKPHVATLYRWAQVGCRGVKLETIQVGGTRCTSIEAMQRFFQALTNNSGTAGLAVPASNRSRAAVKRELEREGL